MRLILLAIVIASTALPFALGGAPPPQTTDPADDANPPLGWNDMLSAGFSIEDGELVVRWTVAAYDAPIFNACWNLDFSVNNEEWFLFAFDNGDGTHGAGMGDGQTVTVDSPWFDDVTVERGAPATFTARFDPVLFPVAPQDVLKFRGVYTCHFSSAFTTYDEVDNGASFTVQGPVWKPKTGAPRVYEGSFLHGSALAYIFSDACSRQATNNVDSSCITLAEEDKGRVGSVTVTTSTGAADDPSLCYYTSMGRFLGCSLPMVPRHATYASVSALGGLGVEWRATFT